MKNIKLGIKPLDENKQNILFQSFQKYFPINKISLYFPYLDYFSNNCKHKILNSKYTLQKLIKKRGRVDIHGKIFKGEIKTKNGKYINNLFIKECPILELLNYYYLLEKYELSLLPSRNNDLYSIINSLENAAYIDVMCCYLCSKLVEKNICPSFPKYNGTFSAIFKEYTFDITDDIELYEDSGLLEDTENFKLYKNNDGIFIKCYDFPVQLLCTEYIPIDIKTIEDIFDIDFIRSITFQIIFSLSMAQKHYNIIHNDLHLGNIMFVSTKMEHIYYKYNDTYYQVPTYGYLIKIIDWNRGTFQINEDIFYNNCYRNNGVAFGQYYLPYSKYKKKKIIIPNTSFDLCIFANSILQEYDISKNSDIYLFLKKMASNKEDQLLYTQLEGFELYTFIAKNIHHAIPKEQLNNICFQNYRILKNNISDGKIIYNS